MRAWVRRSRSAFRRAIGLGLVLLAALAHAGPARALAAKPLRDVLRVRSGATCLSTVSLAPRVEQWLQADSVRADVLIVVEGDPTDRRNARLRVVRDGKTLAHRAFEPGPERCDSLQAAVSLAIALALKATLLDELGKPLPDDPAARLRGWSLSAAGLANHELLPAPAPGLELGVRLALTPGVLLRFAVLGVGAFGVELDRSTASYDAVLIAARVDACARLQLTGGLFGRACAGLLAGPLHARGHDIARTDSSLVAWSAWVNGLGLDLELSARWTLAFDVSLALRLNSVRIGVEDARGAELAGQSLAARGYTVSLGPLYRF